ncbi:hypothetical protein BGZ72_000508 [Mortierella alpina]|nr:hypothetical protein BGZ72_000508 [Mortierella alpina]
MSRPGIYTHDPEAESATTPRTSPFDIPELASLISSYLAADDLARCARVSRSLHDICIPILWRTLDISGRFWTHDNEFRKGLARYGKYYPVERLHLAHTTLHASDMKLLAENCARLKHLDLTAIQVSVVDLRILIHSDPYGILEKGHIDITKKRKAKAGPSTKRRKGSGQLTVDVAELGEDDENAQDALYGDINAAMAHYRQLTDAKVALERACQNKDTGFADKESKQGPGQELCPILLKNTKSSLVDCACSVHSAKFNKLSTRFPFYLESLTFKTCSSINGPACLEVIALLGPQLKRLVLDHMHGVTDQVMIKLVKHCPNLVELQLQRTEITNTFLTSFSQELLSHDSTSNPSNQRRFLESLHVDTTMTSSVGLLAIIKACRRNLTTLSLKCSVANDSVLLALVEDQDPASKNLSEVSSVKLRSRRPQVVNHTIECPLLSDVGLQALFEFATELTSIELQGCTLKDETLMVLAETYRNRMKDLGLGVPAAWKEHWITDEWARVIDQTDASGVFQDYSTVCAASTTFYKMRESYADDKAFTNGRVPGGLRKLLIPFCNNITNKSVRAILRSCVGLESLDISDCRNLSLELFQGPWACTRLKNLNIRGMILELTSNDRTAIRRDGTLMRSQLIEEEEMESTWRFPLAITTYPAEDDFGEDGFYDYIVAPRNQSRCSDDDASGSGVTEDEDEMDGSSGSNESIRSSDAYSSSSGSDNGDSSSDDENSSSGGESGRGDLPLMAPRHTVPCETSRNNPRQRAILRAFYSKLGQLSQLRTLDMSFCDFRVRAKDGLELVLPGLQQNLIEWNLDLGPLYRMFESELKFFGKHFGCGQDFSFSEDVTLEGLQCNTRTAQLQTLILDVASVEDVNLAVVIWTECQGFTLDQQYHPDW